MSFLILPACENHDINEGEKFRPRELHDNFEGSHFTKIKVDGVDYIMLERDNNNPHEGFGFMAFRANVLMEKQDSLLSHVKTIGELQMKIYAKVYNIPLEDVRTEYLTLLNSFLLEYNFGELLEERLTDE